MQRVGLTAITLGAVALFLQSAAGTSLSTIVGDALFVAAGFLAACYLVFVERYRVPALAGNAVVLTFSSLIVLPMYLLFFDSRIPSAPTADVATQALFQGVLMSAAYVLTHYGVLKIGGARVSMIMASIPVLTLLMGKSVAGDLIRPLEVVAVVLITFGIAFGAFLRLNMERPRPDPGSATAR
jgi:drug/metabolite transporter (DMT)-like permease